MSTKTPGYATGRTDLYDPTTGCDILSWEAISSQMPKSITRSDFESKIWREINLLEYQYHTFHWNPLRAAQYEEYLRCQYTEQKNLLKI